MLNVIEYVRRRLMKKNGRNFRLCEFNKLI